MHYAEAVLLVASGAKGRGNYTCTHRLIHVFDHLLFIFWVKYMYDIDACDCVCVCVCTEGER